MVVLVITARRRRRSLSPPHHAAGADRGDGPSPRVCTVHTVVRCDSYKGPFTPGVFRKTSRLMCGYGQSVHVIKQLQITPPKIDFSLYVFQAPSSCTFSLDGSAAIPLSHRQAFGVSSPRPCTISQRRPHSARPRLRARLRRHKQTLAARSRTHTQGHAGTPPEHALRPCIRAILAPRYHSFYIL